MLFLFHEGKWVLEHNFLLVCNWLACLLAHALPSCFSVFSEGPLERLSHVPWLLAYALLVTWITRSSSYLWMSILSFCAPTVLRCWHILIQHFCLQSLWHTSPSEYYFLSLFAQEQEFLSFVSHQSCIINLKHFSSLVFFKSCTFTLMCVWVSTCVLMPL